MVAVIDHLESSVKAEVRKTTTNRVNANLPKTHDVI